MGKLSTTSQDLFHFIESFGKLHNIKDYVSVWMSEDLIQKLETFTCGPFQLFFFEDLFGASENSWIFKHKKFLKNTIAILLNEIFTMDTEQNRKKINDFLSD